MNPCIAKIPEVKLIVSALLAGLLCLRVEAMPLGGSLFGRIQCEAYPLGPAFRLLLTIVRRVALEGPGALQHRRVHYDLVAEALVALLEYFNVEFLGLWARTSSVFGGFAHLGYLSFEIKAQEITEI